MMKKILLSILIAICCVQTVFAAPLELTDDLSGTEVYPYEDGSGNAYTYSYRYPVIEAADEAAEAINAFYQSEVDYAQDFFVPMNAEYNESTGLAAWSTVDYTVMCNNDDYFSVLIKKEDLMDGEEYLRYAAHTFSRKNAKPGSSVALPYLLGILENDENDTWLQERQTEKLNALIRELVWLRMEETGLDGNMEEELLDYIFYPEEDFYLNENGEPVFFLQPGIAGNETELLRFEISLDEIFDEM